MGHEWIIALIGEEPFCRLSQSLSGSQLQSLLLEIFRVRAKARTPAALLAQYRRDRFCQPAPVDQRALLEVDQAFFEAAPDFEALELAPVAPLATCSAVAVTDQHRVLSAVRSTEVVGDSTNVLALECAARLKLDGGQPIHLMTSHRVVRAQPLPKSPKVTQHFRMIAMASGGLQTQGHGFTVDALTQQAQAVIRAVDGLKRRGYRFSSLRIDVLATDHRAALAERIARSLGTRATCKSLDHPYYSGGLRYRIWVTTPDGQELNLADGGSFDWLGQLAANRRAAFVATGIGAQLIASLFAPTGT